MFLMVHGSATTAVHNVHGILDLALMVAHVAAPHSQSVAALVDNNVGSEIYKSRTTKAGMMSGKAYGRESISILTSPMKTTRPPPLISDAIVSAASWSTALLMTHGRPDYEWRNCRAQAIVSEKRKPPSHDFHPPTTHLCNNLRILRR
jgi:hypothetical protein